MKNFFRRLVPATILMAGSPVLAVISCGDRHDLPNNPNTNVPSDPNANGSFYASLISGQCITKNIREEKLYIKKTISNGQLTLNPSEFDRQREESTKILNISINQRRDVTVETGEYILTFTNELISPLATYYNLSSQDICKRMAKIFLKSLWQSPTSYWNRFSYELGALKKAKRTFEINYFSGAGFREGGEAFSNHIKINLESLDSSYYGKKLIPAMLSLNLNLNDAIKYITNFFSRTLAHEMEHQNEIHEDFGATPLAKFFQENDKKLEWGSKGYNESFKSAFGYQKYNFLHRPEICTWDYSRMNYRVGLEAKAELGSFFTTLTDPKILNDSLDGVVDVKAQSGYEASGGYAVPNIDYFPLSKPDFAVNFMENYLKSQSGIGYNEPELWSGYNPPNKYFKIILNGHKYIDVNRIKVLNKITGRISFDEVKHKRLGIPFNRSPYTTDFEYKYMMDSAAAIRDKAKNTYDPKTQDIYLEFNNGSEEKIDNFLY